MSHVSPKRRKLAHEQNGGNEMGIPVLNTSEERTEANLQDDAPTAAGEPKQTYTQPQSNHTKDKLEGALYAGGDFKSSVFKIQVDSLLEVGQKNYEKKFGKANEALQKLKSWIEAIENRDPLSVTHAVKTLQKSNKIAVPFPDPKPDKSAAYKLAYERPSSINVVGSYPAKTQVPAGHPLPIDMVVVMPASIFQEKDYLNYRYFYKRAYYLACIAAGLQETAQEEFEISFKYLNGNSLHPILTAKPKLNLKNTSLTYQIYIIPAAPPGFFLDSKLHPSKNSVRPKDSPEEGVSLPPTPFYNASLKSDINYERYLKLTHSASKQSDAFHQASTLGRIWLGQRGFTGCTSKGGFGHFEWAALTALLLKGGGSKGHGVLSPGYSSYQMFKAILQFLSTRDLTNKPFIYEADDIAIPKTDTPMLYDGPRGQNLMYKMTPWSYALLREEAKVSLEMLGDEIFDQFEATFILKTSQPLQRYDCIVCIPIPTDTTDSVSCDYIPLTAKFGRRVFDVLREGLMDRVKLINIRIDSPSHWSIKSASPATVETPLQVRVVFDPANIDRLVDHGPSAEEKKKAAKFQKFWGEKAELRRFKDGSILESLIWSPGSTYAVFQEVVSYLITRHFGAEANSSVTTLGESFERAVPSSGSSMKHFEALNQAFHVFEKDVRNLEGLPLQLKQLSAIDPQLRSASIEPPAFSPQSPMNVPADVLIQFEGSGRWPDDLVAIQRTKIAFLLKISSLLQEANDSTETRVGLENEDQPLQNCAFLDIIYESGAVFRLRIHNDREQTLLERLVKEKATDSRTRESAVSALSAYKRNFIQLPLLTQSISTHCTRFPLLSPTIRLTKLWFDRHMLSGHISEELIELIVTRIFLQAFPWRAPSSVMTGFLRTLQFIERWNWKLDPLVVDFTGTMTNQDIVAANRRLEAWRKIDPGMNKTVIFASSNHDMTGVAFTDQGPSKVIATRMTALASSAWKLVKEKGLTLDQRTLFSSSTTDYNFLIHLSPKYTSATTASSKHKYKNLQFSSSEKIGYKPIRLYLSELQSLYGVNIIFFYNKNEGSVIGGLWNPACEGKRGFKVNLGYATKAGDEGGVVIDKEAILEEVGRLGGEMVECVEVVT